MSGKTKGNHGAWLGGALFCQIFQATQLCPSSHPVKTYWSDFVRAVQLVFRRYKKWLQRAVISRGWRKRKGEKILFKL